MNNFELLVGSWITSGQLPDDGTVNGLETFRFVANKKIFVHEWATKMPEGDNKGIEVLRATDKNNSRGTIYDNLGNKVSSKLYIDDEKTIIFSGEDWRFKAQFKTNELIIGEYQIKNKDWQHWFNAKMIKVD